MSGLFCKDPGSIASYETFVPLWERLFKRDKNRLGRKALPEQSLNILARQLATIRNKTYKHDSCGRQAEYSYFTVKPHEASRRKEKVAVALAFRLR